MDGVARSYLLYHSADVIDSPGCGALGTTASNVYAVDTNSGHTEHLWGGEGIVTSALTAPTGVGAWLVNNSPCPFVGPQVRQEALHAFDFATGAVTTLDSGDPNENPSAPVSLANLQVYPCSAGCPANRTVVAWTHDGAQRYAQVG